LSKAAAATFLRAGDTTLYILADTKVQGKTLKTSGNGDSRVERVFFDLPQSAHLLAVPVGFALAPEDVWHGWRDPQCGMASAAPPDCRTRMTN